MNISELVKACGLSRQTISNILGAKRRSRATNLDAIAKALKTTRAQLESAVFSNNTTSKDQVGDDLLKITLSLPSDILYGLQDAPKSLLDDIRIVISTHAGLKKRRPRKSS